MIYTHGGFQHPGGVSPMKQEKVEEKEVKEKKKKGFDFSSTTPTGEAVTNFVTPQNNLELGLELLGGGAGVGIGKGVTKLAKTKIGKKLISKLPWLSKLTEPLAKATKNKGFDFTGGKGKTSPKEFNFSGNKPKGGVGGTDGFVKPPGSSLTNFGDYSHKNYNAMQDALRTRGTNLDEFIAKTPTSKVPYTKGKNVKVRASDGGRPIVDVTLPNGEVQQFYKSTGLGKKVGSKDRWIPIAGTQTKYYPKGTINKAGNDISGKPYEWFNKGGSEATYKGVKYKGYHNNAGEYVSVEAQLKAKRINIKTAMENGNLKVTESGYDFDYGGEEFRDISKQLSKMDL